MIQEGSGKKIKGGNYLPPCFYAPFFKGNFSINVL